MNWSGKLVGAVLGWLVRGPIGALLGLVVGHLFDVGGAFTATASTGNSAGQVNQLFFPATFRVMGHVAKADGRVTEQEIASARAVMRALYLGEAQVQMAIAHFTEGKQPQFDLAKELRGFREAIRMHPELAYLFMDIQLQAALGGNGLAAPARARLQTVAAMLGLDAAAYGRIEMAARVRAAAREGAGGGRSSAGAGVNAASRLSEAYSLIEADASMSDQDVVRAYRRQMSRHHPDKLTARGLPDSMLERAKERTQEIQAAYELIREARGMRA